MNPKTATSKEVLEYYNRNWAKIARCYDLGDDGLPVDPAYYRRLIYLNVLEETGADRILDVGCGGGQTVLDALEMGRAVKGIEPTKALVDSAQELLRTNGYEGDVISQNDLLALNQWPSHSFGSIVALSVLPHIQESRWDETHQALVNLIADDGYFIASYRNDLFDLFTFNSFTVDFVINVLFDNQACRPLKNRAVREKIESLISHPTIPGPQHTSAQDKSFGLLTRVNSNPLTMPAYLARFGVMQLKLYFFNFHCLPPLVSSSFPDAKTFSHEMNLNLAEDWRGYFMASTFLVVGKKMEGSPA